MSPPNAADAPEAWLTPRILCPMPHPFARTARHLASGLALALVLTGCAVAGNPAEAQPAPAQTAQAQIGADQPNLARPPMLAAGPAAPPGATPLPSDAPTGAGAYLAGRAAANAH